MREFEDAWDCEIEERGTAAKWVVVGLVLAGLVYWAAYYLK